MAQQGHTNDTHAVGFCVGDRACNRLRIVAGETNAKKMQNGETDGR